MLNGSAHSQLAAIVWPRRARRIGRIFPSRFRDGASTHVFAAMDI